MPPAMDAKVMQLIERTRNIPRRSVLYKSLALSIARKWPSNQLPTIQRAFHALDLERSGSIGIYALAAALNNFGLDKEEAEEVAKVMDLSGDGLVDWTEFVAACVCLNDPVFEDTLRQKFQKADADGDGLLSRRELATLLAGRSADDAVVSDLFAECTTGWDTAGITWGAFRDHFRAQDTERPPTPGFGAGPQPEETLLRLHQDCPFNNPNKRSAMLTL